MTFEDFVKKELVFIKNYVKDAPHSLFVAFKREFEGLSEDKVRDKQFELFELYLNSIDKNSLMTELSLEGRASLILKPSSFRIYSDGVVVITTRGGAKLVGEIELFGRNKREILNNIADWMYVEVTHSEQIIEEYGKDACLIELVDPLKGYTNEDDAKRILDEYDLTPLEILIAGLGIKPTNETLRLFAPRILSLFSYQDRPIHIMQFTNVETGKTEFGTRLEFIFSWTFYSEFPSVAELIYDGRTGSAGAVFTSQGIVIDEMDKVSKSKFLESYQPLNTGLENGLWRRGVSSHGRRLEVYRRVPFLVFGNCNQGNDVVDTRLYDNTRQISKEIIESAISRTRDDDRMVNVYSFLDRFAICDVYSKYVPITEYLITNDHGAIGVLPDSIYRGLVAVIQQRIPTEYVESSEECKGRKRRHAEAVYNVMRVLLDTDLDVDIVRQVVAGNRDFGALFDSVSIESKTQTKDEDSERSEEQGIEYEDIGFDLEAIQ